ncbi:MAG TPA: TerB family tellurite resistance protein, partial [Polyangiaceae bacterium]
EAAHRPTAMVERHLEALDASPLRFTLLSDCLALAYADGDYSKGERKEIHALARALKIDDAQVTALEEAGAALRKAADLEHGPEHHAHVQHLVERLAAVGVPVGIVAGLSAVGLASAGVSAGASALLMGLGIASGFGAVLGLSAGTVMGVKWLHDKIAGDE